MGGDHNQIRPGLRSIIRHVFGHAIISLYDLSGRLDAGSLRILHGFLNIILRLPFVFGINLGDLLFAQDELPGRRHPKGLEHPNIFHFLNLTSFGQSLHMRKDAFRKLRPIQWHQNFLSRRPSGLRKTIADGNSLAHRTTWLRFVFPVDGIRKGSNTRTYSTSLT